MGKKKKKKKKKKEETKWEMTIRLGKCRGGRGTLVIEDKSKYKRKPKHKEDIIDTNS